MKKNNITSISVKSSSSNCILLTLLLLSLKTCQAFTSPTPYISHSTGLNNRASLLLLVPSSSCSHKRRYSRTKASSSRLHFFLRDKSESVIEEPSTDQEEQQQSTMGDLVQFLKLDSDSKEENTVIITQESNESQEESLGISAENGVTIAALSLLSIGIAAVTQMDMTETLTKVQAFFADPQATLEAVVNSVQEMGPSGYLYFGAVYTVAEILAIPAIPLTASAGYLFGVRNGTIVVLMAASIAASVSFLIGRTFLRSYVKNLLKKYPEFQKIDRAIGEEGFKIMLLLRLSPIFPFALSNYLYGVTSIDFWSYFFGTMLGFTPGTIAYVFTGEIGKSLTLDSASAEPCGGLVVAANVGVAIYGKAWVEKGNGTDDGKTATIFKANGLTPYAETFELTDDPEDAFFPSAMVPNKDNLSAVVVDKANVGMFLEIDDVIDEFLYAQKVVFNFQDGYVSIALAGEAGFVGIPLALL